MKICRVTWFNPGIGFGYLREEGATDHKKDILVPSWAIESGEETLKEGWRVVCTVREDFKGPIAENVQVITPVRKRS